MFLKVDVTHIHLFDSIELIPKKFLLENYLIQSHFGSCLMSSVALMDEASDKVQPLWPK